MVASAVVEGFAIMKDFGPDNASDLQKSMDILGIISSGIVVLGEVAVLLGAEIALASTIGAVLGPVGVVIGIVAFVLSFFM